jgi:predicted nucleotidyltransferase
MTDKRPRKHTEARQLQEITTILREHLPELREQYKVKSLGLFGSYVRAEQHRRSDLDLLVDFEEAPTLLQLSALQRQLSDLVGVKVDLVLKRTLKPAIGEVILSEAIYI